MTAKTLEAVRSSRAILLVDPNLEFLQKAQQDAAAQSIPPKTALNGKDAQLILSNKEIRLQAVIINIKITNTNWTSVVKCCKLHRPSLPLYLLADKEDLKLLSQADIDALGITHTLNHPITYPQIVKLIFPNIVFYDVNAIPEDQEVNSQSLEVGKELSAQDALFMGIPVQDFIPNIPIHYDVFIRLSSEKYIKVLHEKNSFDQDQIDKFLKKGIKFLHIEKLAQGRHLALCEQIAAKIATSRTTSPQIQTAALLNHGQETFRYLQGQGINSQSLDFAVGFVNNIEKVVKSNHMQHQLVQSFLNDFIKYDHAVSTSIVAGLIGKALSFVGHHAVQVIGISGLFHDIGLLKLPQNIQDEDELDLTPDQLKIYHSHPELSTEILVQLSSIDPVVIQAVNQHHERRTRKGYPYQLGPGSINRVAEIIGISDDFVRLISRLHKKQTEVKMQEELAHIFNGYSFETTEAFKKVFLENFDSA